MIYSWIGLYILSYVLAYIALRITFRIIEGKSVWTTGDRVATLLISLMGPIALILAISIPILYLSGAAIKNIFINFDPNKPAKW